MAEAPASDAGAATPLDRRVTGQPLLSIVVNNHNYAQFLGEAVDSALRQSWPHVEVIVVDDGSTDDSRSVIESFGERIVPVFKANGGQASALNAGFERSRGEIVLFLDADDRLRAEAADLLVAAWRTTPDAARVQFRMEVIDAGGTPTGIRKPPPDVALLSGDLRRHYLAFPDDIWRLPTSANAFPAWVLRSVCPVPEEEYRGGADTYLTHVTPLFGPVISIDAVGAEYRVHGGNRYELDSVSLNLDRIRRNVTHTAKTNRHIERLARQLGLAAREGSPSPMAVSFIVNRAISLKLEPAKHPIPSDRLSRLLLLGARAARRRFDIGWPMRALYAAWFVALVTAPRPLARRVAEWMVFPQTRGRLNSLLHLARRGGRRESAR